MHRTCLDPTRFLWRRCLDQRPNSTFKNRTRWTMQRTKSFNYRIKSTWFSKNWTPPLVKNAVSSLIQIAIRSGITGSRLCNPTFPLNPSTNTKPLGNPTSMAIKYETKTLLDSWTPGNRKKYQICSSAFLNLQSYPLRSKPRWLLIYSKRNRSYNLRQNIPRLQTHCSMVRRSNRRNKDAQSKVLRYYNTWWARRHHPL